MFYKPNEPHGLPHNPYNALILPRPIGWISTVSKDGVANLAPYSFFNGVAYMPPQVMYSLTGGHNQGGTMKDSHRNVVETEEFVVNLATYDLREAVNLSCIDAPSDIDEFDLAGVTKARSELVAAPRVAESPAQFECRLVDIVELKSENPDGSGNRLIIGEVVGIHIDERIMTDGMIDYKKLNPLSRLGYKDYGILGETFSMDRPTWPLET